MKFTKIAAAAIAASMMAGGASAATLLDRYDRNDFNGGNDPFGSGFLEGNPAEIITASLAKCDEQASADLTCPDDQWEDGSAQGDYSEAFTLTYNLVNDLYIIDWTFDPDLVLGTSEVLFPHYVAVKQATFFDLWELDASERFGGFINTGLEDISHVSFYNTGDMTPIPLPAAGWLLLAGIGGLAAMRRRKSV